MTPNTIAALTVLGSCVSLCFCIWVGLSLHKAGKALEEISYQMRQYNRRR